MTPKDSTLQKVPFFDLTSEVQKLRSQIEVGWARCLDTGTFINGPQVSEFEESFANYCGTKWCVSVGSGTSALKLALQALDVGPGDEVIVPANTYIASALAVSQTGARPALVDVDEHYHLQLDRVRRLIGPRTKAIMAVHLYGQAVPMQPLLQLAKDHGLRVIEDACQAHGAITGGRRVGSLGDVGCFSFYPSKNLGAYGDGGAIVTNNEAIADTVRLKRDFGQRVKYEHLAKGENSRLDTLQAVVLLTKLSYLDEWNAKRRKAAATYDYLLDKIGVAFPQRHPGPKAHVYHLYVIELEHRDEIRLGLQEDGIETAIHYPIPIHRQPAYGELDLARGSFPMTEHACTRLLSLPMFPDITESQIERVVCKLQARLVCRRPSYPRPSHQEAQTM